MFNRLFHFLKGYVIIEICGAETERFLSICARRGIDICDVLKTENNSVRLQMQKSDFFKIRPIVYKTHLSVKIIQKVGFSNLYKNYRTRYTFFFGIIFCIVFFAITSRYIWVIEINGVKDADYNEIVEILKNDGVYVGAKKGDIKEKRIIKQSLVNKTDNIAWAWIYIEGAKARVEIYEKHLPSIPLESTELCDIVASRDGFITSINTIRGHDLVLAGESVNMGDVLISSKVPIFKPYQEENYMYVHSSGTVRATTIHKKSGVYSLNYESKIPTGRKKRYFSLEAFGKLFNSYDEVLCPYENCNTTYTRHELSVPYFGYCGICINERICEEVTVESEPLMIDVAVEMAKNDLEEKIAKELLKNAELISSEVSYEKINESSISVSLKMTVEEDIGVSVPIQKEE